MLEQVACLIVAVAVGETLALECWQTFKTQTVQCRIVVVCCRRGLDILALAVEAAHYLWPLQDAVCHPVTVAACCTEYLQSCACLGRTHGGGGIMQGQLCAVIINPNALASFKQGKRLAEHHAVPTLVQVAVRSVHIPRDSQITVVVGLVNTITIIPVVEVVAHVAVSLFIDCYHHVLGSLVNGSLIIRCHNIVVRAVRVEVVVHLMLPLQQTVGLGSCYGIAVKGDGERCTVAVEYLFTAVGVQCGILIVVVRKVLVTLLAESQFSEQLIWHFLPLCIQVVQIVVVGVTALIVR